MTDMPLLQVVNDLGVVFNVRVVLPGESYGKGDRLAHDGAQPMIEFFDSRNTEGFTPIGQFVSRYNYDTLRAHVDDDPAGVAGLQLYGDEPTWAINAANVVAAVLYADERRTLPRNFEEESDDNDL